MQWDHASLGLAQARPTLAWLHCTRVCVCLFACLDRPLTISHFRLLLCMFCVMRYFKKGSCLIVLKTWTMNSLPWSMVTTRTETTRGLAYSVCRAIEVTAWQSVDAVCLCCLTHGQVRSLDSHFFWLQQWGLPVVHAQKNGTAFIYPCHLHMTCSVCWTSPCAACFSQAWLTAFLCCTRVYFSVTWGSVTFW